METSPASEIVLIGDSVFDNTAYVPYGRTVEQQLREQIPSSVGLTCLAEDGATISDIAGQLLRVPSHASHLIVSIGGNDALLRADLLQTRTSTAADALELFFDASRSFMNSYRHAVKRCTEFEVPVTVCTIYGGHHADPHVQSAIVAALMFFNDAILQVALEFRASVLDVRKICNDPKDFTNAIEPSIHGAKKIAAAIRRVLEDSSSTGRRRTCICT
ncbi:MAG: lipase [Methylibium sp.]|nr:lipase [Methylibium sp.]